MEQKYPAGLVNEDASADRVDELVVRANERVEVLCTLDALLQLLPGTRHHLQSRCTSSSASRQKMTSRPCAQIQWGDIHTDITYLKIDVVLHLLHKMNHFA